MTYLSHRNIIADTGLQVSPLGLGTVKLGRDKAVKYPKEFKIPDDKEALNLLSLAWDLGINLIDTAPAYGHSEERLGKLLKNQSKDWIVATKAGEYFDPNTGQSHYDFTPASLKASIENSLRQLGRDSLDIVLIHSDGNDVEIIQKFGALETLNELKREGLIRATGMSTKTVDGGLLAIQQSDIAMVTHNIEYQEEMPVIQQANISHKAIFIKKALSSGHFANKSSTQDSLQANFDCIFSEPAVSSIIVGTINPHHLKDNVLKACSALENNR